MEYSVQFVSNVEYEFIRGMSLCVRNVILICKIWKYTVLKKKGEILNINNIRVSSNRWN
jgi:hypothetical protein